MQISQVQSRDSAQHGRGGSQVPEGGFTLIELLLVVVVLGILAAVVVFSLGSVTAGAAVSACEANVATVETAVSAYNVQTGAATPATPLLLTSGVTPYLESFPSSTDYSITLVNAAVMVAAPTSATPVAATSSGACSGAGSGSATPTSSTTSTTSTTTSTTTTTMPVSNGVDVAALTNSFGTNPTTGLAFAYGGQEILRFTNPSSITSMTLTIRATTTGGMSYSSQFVSFPGGDLNFNQSTSGGTVVATWSDMNRTISANYSSGEVALQLSGTSTGHATSGDTWSVTTTSAGITSTLTGTF